MEDLLYFTFSKLLIKVEYTKENNTLSYSSHREISDKERKIIENYILTKVASKTSYYKQSPSTFMYSGIDISLQRDLKMMRLKKMLKSLSIREKKATEEVDELINSSLSNYYFERIGDKLLQIRNQIKDETDINFVTVKKTKAEIEELVKAYNVYSDQKTTLERAVPADLKKLFEYN
jgi:hypothetical protein